MCNPWCCKFVADSLPIWPENSTVLEVGARNVNGSVRSICEPKATRYIGADLQAGPGVDVVADVTKLSATFPAESFDVVITTEMMEHVPDWPTAWAELLRVVRPGGLLILTTRSPGFPRHDYPGDFWRFTPADIRGILSDVAEIVQLADDDTLEYACGVGVVARKKPGLDYTAWRARLAQEVALYQVEACVPLTYTEWTAAPPPTATEPLRRRIADLEQHLFDSQVVSQQRHRKAEQLSQQITEPPVSERDKHILGLFHQATNLEIAIAVRSTTLLRKLKGGANTLEELARLPTRALRYLLVPPLRARAWNSVQRRWMQRHPVKRPIVLPHLDWLLNKLEINIPVAEITPHLGGYLTPQEVTRYRAVIDPLRAAATGKPTPIMRALGLAPAGATVLPRLRLLFVCGEFPNPVHGGGGRVADFIKVLGEYHDVFVAAWYDRKRDHDAFIELAPYCRAIHRLSFEDLEGGCADKIQRLLDGFPADVVHYEWPRSLQSLSPRLGRFHLYTHMEVVSRSLWMDLQRLKPLSPEWCQRLALLLNMLGVETLAAASTDMQITVTHHDAEFLARFYPSTPYYVVNHGINLDQFTLPNQVPEPNTVVFTGNFTHYPNQDAVHFFMSEIYPQVLTAIPDLRVLLVGANPPPDIQKHHDGHRVIVTGQVPDIRPFIQRAAVCIAPLISGAGLRTKVVQYAALHRTSVVTSIAADDLDFENGQDVYIADQPDMFTRHLIELLRNPVRAAAMARRAHAKVLKLYDNRHIAELGLGNLYRRLQAGKEAS